jgi:hypothetical protein
MTLRISTDNISTTALQTLGGGVKITSLTYPNSATAADPAGSETITVNGSGFNTGAKVYIDTTLCTTTYVSSTSLTFVSPAKSIASYHLFVYNTDGSNGMFPAGMIYSSLPTWVTSAGALTFAPLNQSYSQSVSATGDGTITYSLTSGSLPTGLSLNTSTGAITGTATGSTGTSNFTITATDSQTQKSNRSFSITVNNVITTDYLVVAAGGGGGRYGGGGGAGGLIYTTGINLTPSIVYTITIGAGGTVGDNIAGTQGGNSSISGSGFSTVTSIGGGGGSGGDASGQVATSGGSGGGGASDGSGVGGKGVYPGSTYLSQTRQGYDGGSWTTNNNYMAGGGGAGAIGTSPSSASAAGGVGVASSITGTSVYYAGGGGGGGWNGQGAGGTGGGGAGGAYNVTPIVGTPNTGGGGGGGGYDSTYRAGAIGGSGVVILRFLSSVTPAATTGSPTITTDGSYKVYKFTASGSITF